MAVVIFSSGDQQQESRTTAVKGGSGKNGQPATRHYDMEHNPIGVAVNLLSQQVWCWGRDILRSKGNWLLEVGFKRIEPPPRRKDCSSLYILELPRRQNVILRGFGVFFGDPDRGSVFLPRYEFRPQYSQKATLDKQPWSDEDLPKLRGPTESQKASCASLTLDLINWIHGYEATIVERLGIKYRRKTLRQWNNGRRPFTPAEEFAGAWQELSVLVSANADVFISRPQS